MFIVNTSVEQRSVEQRSVEPVTKRKNSTKVDAYSVNPKYCQTFCYQKTLCNVQYIGQKYIMLVLRHHSLFLSFFITIVQLK